MQNQSSRLFGPFLAVVLSLAPGAPVLSGAGPAAPDARHDVRRHLAVDPFALISRERLFATLRELTCIGTSSLWRTSASGGEAEALDLITAHLGELSFLRAAGLEVERQRFRTYLATEVWASRLELTVGGQRVEVPAHALSGSREGLALALRFDSDGAVNDATRNPVVVQEPAVVIRSAEEVTALESASLAGRVAFLDYAVIDRSIMTFQAASDIATALLAKEPAGLVLVTSLSNTRGESHGSFVGDLSVLVSLGTVPAVPTVYSRLEDLAAAGIRNLEELGRVEAARLVWDADVFSPGSSSNVIATIPGADRSRAVILGAHADSANTPGAMDNGSGTVTLLEVARLLDAARLRPPVDLVLAWFGSHERGLYGSTNFVTTHQDLLDRALAMLQVDCLTRPLDGIRADLYLETWPFGRFGDPRLTWPEYLTQAARDRGAETVPLPFYGIASDNASFAPYDVPNANLVFMNPFEMDEVHYDGHLHDPYDTVELALEQADTLEAMVRVALTAALRAGRDDPPLRLTPRPDRRAVFVGSHTEPPHMTPAGLTDLGMALAWDGFDVDTVPYGRAVSAADLSGAGLVVVLPVAAYPSAPGDVTPAEEAWSAQEVAALQGYAAGGGLLVLTNSANRLKYANQVLEPNPLRGNANAVASPLGVTFGSGTLSGASVRTSGSHALIQGVSTLQMAPGNSVPFTLRAGQVLAQVGSQPAVALVDFGGSGGKVLVLADLGILGNGGDQPANLQFWRNLARYARSRWNGLRT
jgi:hypothetical protein